MAGGVRGGGGVVMGPGSWSVFSVFGDAVGVVAGWSFDKVIEGVYGWIANGLVLLLMATWRGMEEMSTPNLTADWFANGLVGQLSVLSGSIMLVMVFVTVIRAAVNGQPELLGDIVRQWVLVVVKTGLLVTFLNAVLVATDEAANYVWGLARPDLASMTDTLASVARTSTESGKTFVMPAMLVLTIVAIVAMVFVFLMRGALLYVVAAFAPLILAGAILPSMRQSRVKLEQTLVALILSKLAIAVALTVAAKVIVSAGEPGSSPDQQLYTVAMGAVSFVLAAIAPWLLYRLIPIVAEAGASHGLGSTAFRGAMTAVQVATMTRAAAGSRSPGSRPIPGGTSAPAPTGSGRGGGAGLGAGGATPPVPAGSRPAARPVPAGPVPVSGGGG